MSTPLRVLIIQDSTAETALLIEELQLGGYVPKVQQVATAAEMQLALERQSWDLIMADASLADFSISAALKVLRDRALDLPFVILSDAAQEDSSVLAMKVGADYICKNDLTRLIPVVEQELREVEMRQMQRQVEATLREREANLLALIENTQDVVWSVDCNYKLVTLNSNFVKQFFLTFRMRPYKGMDTITCLPEQMQQIWVDYYDRALRGERFAVEEHYEFGARAIEFEISFNPIRADQHQITGVAVFGRDITDRKRSEEALHQAKDQLQAVLDAVPGCVSWFSSDLTYLGINRYLAATFNLRPEDFSGKKIGFLESSAGFGEFVHDFFASSLKESSVEIATQVDGERRDYLMVAQKYFQDQAAVFIGIDITDRKQIEEALLESQERYALAVQGANDGLWDWNLKTNQVYFSPRWKSMLGYEEPEIGNSPEEWFSRVHPKDVEKTKAEIFRHFGGLSRHFEHEYRILHKDGKYRWALSRGIAVRDEEGKASRMAGSQTDITERKKAEEQLLHDAFHDALTDLPNRALLLDRLGQAIERSKRPGSSLFAVLFLDLDRFKMVNDSLGHQIGDELLQAIAQKLPDCVRTGDTIARLGGDEFVILLQDIEHLNDAIRTAERIHAALETPFVLEGHEVFTTASIGIALSETGYDKPEDLLRDADIAMYRAKAQGRARHEVFDTGMHDRAVALMRLEMDLRRAIERQEFLVYYQPIVSLATGQLSGFEALIRWQHPERGLVSPTEFIPTAEDTGLIVPMGFWVLHEACRQTRLWQQTYPQHPPLTLSVNLSGRQFSQPNLVRQIDEILQRTHFPPQCLKLEITESVVMEDAETAIAMLCELKALGVTLQMDDFGTGYSSLSYLHRFPTDTLKIDRSFVIRLGLEDDSSEIVRTIVTLAHSLGMSVTAEGIETLEQMLHLKSVESEYGQGYFFSQPMDSGMAEKLLATGKQWGPAALRNVRSIGAS